MTAVTKHRNVLPVKIRVSRIRLSLLAGSVSVSSHNRYSGFHIVFFKKRQKIFSVVVSAVIKGQYDRLLRQLAPTLHISYNVIYKNSSVAVLLQIKQILFKLDRRYDILTAAIFVFYDAVIHYDRKLYPICFFFFCKGRHNSHRRQHRKHSYNTKHHSFSYP